MKININDYNSVKNFLSDDFENIMDLISEASLYIYSIFEVDVLILDLHIDPEEGYHTLCVGIPYNYIGGDCLLEKFEDLWFIDNMHRFKGKAYFYVSMPD